MKALIVIVGPTAVGKSQLALSLAQHSDGEIVNADSRQVYRYMDIGTAKPSPESQSRVRHHLLDLINPDQDFSLALYQQAAYQTIAEIQSRNKLPLLVGGSGQYVRAVVEGWHIPAVLPDPELRRNLEAQARSQGWPALYAQLEQLDPLTAHRLDPRNLRRLIRALEVCLKTGPVSQPRQRKPPAYPILILGLTLPRHELYQRIDQRIEEMMARGWLEEIKGLLERGYSLELPALSSLGYHELGLVLNGQRDLAQTIQDIKYRSHNLARHQYAWFRTQDERIHWLEAKEDAAAKALKLAQAFLEREGIYALH